jgi:hypothetical protein
VRGTVEWSRPALEDVARLECILRDRVEAALEAFAETGHEDVKKLHAMPGRYR